MKDIIYDGVAFKVLEEWPNYAVSEDGRVLSINYHQSGQPRELKPAVVSKGYLQVVLSRCNKRKNLLVHRLVAETFIPNPEGRPEVDHINTDKTDNRVENLRWVTSYENHHNPITEFTNREANIKVVTEYSYKAVYCVELDMVFESESSAAVQLGLHSSNISRCCLGKQKTTGGYHFRYHILKQTNLNS